MVNTITYSYSKNWVENLNNISQQSGEKLIQLHTDFGKYIGSKINEFISEKGISPKR